jgi:hypothetical protein
MRLAPPSPDPAPVGTGSAPVRRQGRTSQRPSNSAASHRSAGCQHQVVSRPADRDLVGALGDAPVARDSVWPVEPGQQPPVGGDRLQA